MARVPFIVHFFQPVDEFALEGFRRRPGVDGPSVAISMLGATLFAADAKTIVSAIHALGG
jgi:hypothetical protein